MLLSTTVVSTRIFRPWVTPRSCATSTTPWGNCSMTFGSINCPSPPSVLASGTFAFAHGCGSEDAVLLGLRTPCPEVAHLPASHPTGASTVPTTPRYPRLDLDATATVVDDVI